MKLSIMLFICSLLVSFLTWNNTVDNQILTNYENRENAIINNYSIPDWYTWAIAIVTEENIEEPIYQTWEQLLYINEVLWFQVLLWEERNWAKIWWTDQSVSDDAIYEIVFALPDTRYSDNFEKDRSFFNTISIRVIDGNNTEAVDFYLNMWINRDNENVIFDKSNNLIYYMFYNFDKEEIQHVFSWYNCPEIWLNCPYLIDYIFYKWFKIFKI